MSPIERKWWFAFPLMAVATLATYVLFDSAQVPSTASLARAVIFGLCFGSLYRCLSFCIWLLLLWVAPGAIDRKLLNKSSA
ncbi:MULTISPECIES: hypothetical protein [unclassified Janthinobacterium]|uniref:hypothetical protein n=1 Tax=unclassified Janthinobacterium TaxID=2610881 RepID=UPI00160AF5F8|nr:MULTISPECIES: hypothetical protein [unclassified Janthinobacterium]MBB5608966.1 hypothetical protein [Janthinobacterium sp. S3T4]MBB5615179.1 hypothetical protein [Janthinobacterium sp. S3M3]